VVILQKCIHRDFKKKAFNIKQIDVKFSLLLDNTLTYLTPEDIYPVLSLKQPEFLEIRTHDYWLAMTPFASTLLEETRTAREIKQEIPGGRRLAEVVGTVARRLSTFRKPYRPYPRNRRLIQEFNQEHARIKHSSA
jgi:hypothetical protein